MSALELLANLGAEEGPGHVAMAREPAVQSAARLWALLFPRAATLRTSGDAASVHWPERLEQAESDAAFDWLAMDEGLVPWLSTDEAERQAEAAGLTWRGSDPAIVTRVHDKAFAREVALREGLTPRGLRGVDAVLSPDLLRDADAALERIADEIEGWPAWLGRRFTLKPRFGSSGRGRVAGSRHSLSAPDLRGALPRLAERGGALLEPWLDRRGDVSTQLLVDSAGSVVLLGSLDALMDVSGLYRGHRGQVDSRGRVFSADRDDERFREAAAIVAAAAAAEGYRGPCGVDALRFRDETGASERRPVVELNARFTTGTVVIGLVRRALAVVRRELGLRPGDRRSFHFGLDAPAGGWAAACARGGEAAMSIPLAPSGARPQPGLLFAADDATLDIAIGEAEAAGDA